VQAPAASTRIAAHAYLPLWALPSRRDGRGNVTPPKGNATHPPPPPPVPPPQAGGQGLGLYVWSAIIGLALLALREIRLGTGRSPGPVNPKAGPMGSLQGPNSPRHAAVARR
jgi:hypothetical protein